MSSQHRRIERAPLSGSAVPGEVPSRGRRRHGPIRVVCTIAAVCASTLAVGVDAVAQDVDPAPSTTIAETPELGPTGPEATPPPRSAGPPSPPPAPPAATGEPVADGRNERGEVVGFSDALASVEVTSDRFDLADAALKAAMGRLAAAQAKVADATTRAQSLAATRAALDQSAVRALVRKAKLDRMKEVFRRRVRDFAVARLVGRIDDDVYPDPNETIAEALERSHEGWLVDETSRQAQTALDHMQEAGRAQAAVLDSLQAQIADNTADATRADRDNGAASSDVNAATAELPALTTERQLARANTLVGGSDLPLVALDAYWRAAQAASSDPKLACSIDWWALAGIGRTESNHGRYAGGEAAPDGRVTEPIYGIALDGSRGTAVIRDSDKGVLDGDPGIDRAVGVMQFIPSTWKRYGADLSGDGIADPQNVYDGALSAARYLCATSKDLVNDAGLSAAYFSYNHSLAYVSTVLARSRAYQQLGVPSANRRG